MLHFFLLSSGCKLSTQSSSMQGVASELYAKRKHGARPQLLWKLHVSRLKGLAVQTHRGKRKVGTSRVNLLGDRYWAGNLLLWFPAAWMLSVAEAIHKKNKEATTHQGAALSASAGCLSSIGFKLKRWHADRTGQTLILHGSTNVPWLTLDPDKIVHLFATSYEGLLTSTTKKLPLHGRKRQLPGYKWVYCYPAVSQLMSSCIQSNVFVTCGSYRYLLSVHSLKLLRGPLREDLHERMGRHQIYDILFGRSH